MRHTDPGVGAALDNCFQLLPGHSWNRSCWQKSPARMGQDTGLDLKGVSDGGSEDSVSGRVRGSCGRGGAQRAELHSPGVPCCM